MVESIMPPFTSYWNRSNKEMPFYFTALSLFDMNTVRVRKFWLYSGKKLTYNFLDNCSIKPIRLVRV